MAKIKQTATVENTNDKDELGVNTFFHFDKEAQQFKENKWRGINEKTKKESLLDWPYTPSSEEVQAVNFIDTVLDKESGYWYPQRDKSGSPINGTGTTHRVRTIIRLRTKKGEEVLLTFGRLYGFDKYGDPVRIPCSCPERWKKTSFGYVRRFYQKKMDWISVNQGPSGFETIYEMPFTKENVMKLWDKREDEFNANNGFIVQDLAGGDRSVQVKAVSGDLDETLKLFTESSFDYLFKGEYVPLHVRAENRQKAIAQGIIPPGPMIVNQLGEEVTANDIKPAPHSTYG